MSFIIKEFESKYRISLFGENGTIFLQIKDNGGLRYTFDQCLDIYKYLARSFSGSN